MQSLPKRAGFQSCWCISNQSQSGFLLIEVLLAVTILGIGGVMAMRAIIASLESAQISQQYTKAMFLTAAKMEEMIEEYGFSARRSGETTLANYEGVDGDTYAYEITVDPDRKRLVFVLRVKTIWVHRGSTKSYELYCETPMRRLIKDYAR